MDSLDLNKTQPTETNPTATELPQGKAPRLGLVILLGILLLGGIAALSAYGGYQSGMNRRNALRGTQLALFAQTQFAQAGQDIDNGRLALASTRLAWFQSQDAAVRRLNDTVAIELQVQYQLAVEDLQAKRYTAAQARLEWVLAWQPDFPDAAEKLSEALFYQRITATPTPAPTSTPIPFTPTPDTRGKDQLFADAQAALTAGNWTVVIDTLLTLRKQDAAYKAVQVDGMLYLAFSSRGIDKIQGNGATDPTITKVDLEGGSYDLALAEQFGLLDQEAKKWRQWADWYVSGASFWDVDWPRALSYFELLATVAPGLSDGNGYYAISRYRLALTKYGDFLASQGKWCEAQEQYQKALDAGADPAVQPTASYAGEQCHPPEAATPLPPQEATPMPTLEVTPTPTTELPPIEPSPTEAPTLEPTLTETATSSP